MRLDKIVQNIQVLSGPDRTGSHGSDIDVSYAEDEDYPGGAVYISVDDDYLPLSLSEWNAIVTACKDGALDVAALKLEFEESREDEDAEDVDARV